MLNIAVSTPKTPYEAKFTFKEERSEYEDQRELFGWTFVGKIWADEDTNFKTRIRLDYAQCGWLTVEFGGGPDSYIEACYYEPEDLETMNMFHYVRQLVNRISEKPELGFDEQQGFRW